MPEGGQQFLEAALRRLGAGRVEATLLASLLRSGPAGTAKILQRTGLRQPEVSVGMQELRARGWVEAEPVPREGKGRPMHRYILKVPLEDLRSHYEQRGLEEVAAYQEALHIVRTELG